MDVGAEASRLWFPLDEDPTKRADEWVTLRDDGNFKMFACCTPKRMYLFCFATS
jgi:hypothetical protein